MSGMVALHPIGYNLEALSLKTNKTILRYDKMSKATIEQNQKPRKEIFRLPEPHQTFLKGIAFDKYPRTQRPQLITKCIELFLQKFPKEQRKDFYSNKTLPHCAIVHERLLDAVEETKQLFPSYQ